MEERIIEKRIITDENGFVKEQIRFIPLNEWESGDGWRTTRILECHKS